MRTVMIAAALASVLALGCGSDGGGAGGGAAGSSGAGAAGTAGSSGAAGAAGSSAVDLPGGSGWRADPSLPVAIQEIAAAVVDDEIWVVGGFEPLPTAAVRSFDPDTGAWRDRPPLPQSRHHVGLVAHDGDLYSLGGLEKLDFTPKRDCWVLRNGADEWQPIAPLPAARGAGVAAALGDRLYIVGGYGDGNALLPTVLIYDIESDSWSSGAPMPEAREHLAGFVYDGEIWAVGGRKLSLSSNVATVEIYDPVADSWRASDPLPTARGGMAGAVLGDRAWVVGGEQPDMALDVVESVDLSTGQWRTDAPVPTRRHGHAMVELGGRVWVVGGADEPIFAAVSAVESYRP